MKISTTPSVLIRIILWIALLLGGIIGGIAIDRVYFWNIFTNPIWHILTFIPGLFLMKIAFRAAGCGGRELAKSGRDGDIPRLETNKLVTSGIYSKMRHPMLFGLTLVPIALALMIGSLGYILFIAPLEMLFIIAMVLTLEERECKMKFGRDYKEYSKRVPAICLSKECIKELLKK